MSETLAITFRLIAPAFDRVALVAAVERRGEVLCVPQRIPGLTPAEVARRLIAGLDGWGEGELGRADLEHAWQLQVDWPLGPEPPARSLHGQLRAALIALRDGPNRRKWRREAQTAERSDRCRTTA